MGRLFALSRKKIIPELENLLDNVGVYHVMSDDKPCGES